MDESDRNELLKRTAAKDMSALGMLLMEYSAALQSRIERRLIRRHAACDPGEIIQEAFVEAVKNAPARSFPSPAAFYRWLEVIAVNKLRDALRRRREPRAQTRAATAFGSVAHTLLNRIAGRESTPSRVFHNHEQTMRLQIAIALLKEEYREIILARFFRDEPVSEIAEQTGRSCDAVYKILHRALLALRKNVPPDTKTR